MISLEKFGFQTGEGRTVGKQVFYELMKARRSILYTFQRPFEPAMTRHWDKTRMQRIRFTEGKSELSRKVAVFLIFQPDGIRETTFLTLKGLAAAGYSPVIISNCAVPESSKDRLRENVTMILERPNLGYDFGGYRDGIWWVDKQFVDLDEIIILNDSFWFADGTGEVALSQLQTSNDPVVGYFGAENSRGKTKVIHSFLFLVRHAALVAPEFNSYWSDMTLMHSKTDIVQKCEARMAQEMVSAELKSAVIHQPGAAYDLLWDFIRNKDLEVLDELLFMVKTRRAEVSRITDAMHSGELSLLAGKEALAPIISRLPIFETFAFLGLRDLNYGILKRKFITSPGAARDKFLQLLETDPSLVCDEVWKELVS
ncbi:MAG: rhamnan synthesis F family protein [Pseudomonadota bacterium]